MTPTRPVPNQLVPEDYKIPCDVLLPPSTRIKRGCSLSTLMVAMAQRENFPPKQRVFTTTHPASVHCDNCGCTWLDDGLNPIGCPYCKQSEQETKIMSLQEDVAEWKRVAAAQAELHGEAEDRAERLAEALETCLEVEGRPSIIEMARAALAKEGGQ